MYYSELDRQIIHEGFVAQLMKDYTKIGYKILNNHEFDLVLKNGEKILAIEVVIVGKKKDISLSRIEKLRKLAKNKGYNFSVEYCRTEKTTEIKFEGLEQIIQQYFEDELPSEFDELSTHTSIESVDDVSLTKLSIHDDRSIEAAGIASICLHLQWGSEGDLGRDDGAEASETVTIKFDAYLLGDFTIDDFNFEII